MAFPIASVHNIAGRWPSGAEHRLGRATGIQPWLILDRARSVSPYGTWHGRAVAIATKVQIRQQQVFGLFPLSQLLEECQTQQERMPCHVPAKMLENFEDDWAYVLYRLKAYCLSFYRCTMFFIHGVTATLHAEVCICVIKNNLRIGSEWKKVFLSQNGEEEC